MIGKLKINEFRCLVNQEIELGKYLTIISGRNSTGKSTVLGMLGNAGEIKKKEACTYANRQFRAEFSELFKGSEEYDKSGSEKYEVCLCDELGEIKDYRKFRVTWQKKNKDSAGKRFRIVPYRKDEQINTSAKLNIPVLYLGLSRLFPVGEAEETTLTAASLKFKTEEHRKWFVEKYKHILSIQTDIRDVSAIKIGETDKKSSVGISTDNYDYLSNSSGQDNLGQLLLALLSFKNMKEHFKGNWNGGLLLIDELDSTLHPAAQNRLLDLLVAEARSLNIQVVATTHSMSLLKHVAAKIAHNKGEKNNVELYYFTNANRALEIKRNIEYSYIESDLMIETLNQVRNKIKIYSEDEENRWLLRNIIHDYMSYVEILEVSLGCSELMSVYKADLQYFGNTIIVLDGDVEEKVLNGVSQSIRDRMNNILKLPDTVRPEEVIYNYLLNLPSEHPYWSACSTVGLTWQIINDNGPQSSKYNNAKDREKYKEWFKNNVDDFNSTHLYDYWAADNKNCVDTFVKDFVSSFNSIAERIAIPKVKECG